MKESFVDLAVVNDESVRLYVAKGRAEEDWIDTRMLILDARSVVGHHDINARVVSVDAGPGFLLAALSMDGIVSLASKAGVQFERIEGAGTGAGKFGYLKAVRWAGDTMYACGDMRQIYRRNPQSGAWERYDFGLRETDPRVIGCALNHMTGEAPDALFAVGDRGAIYHFDGAGWIQSPSPTNVSLERAMVSKAGDVWACGSLGTVLRGDGLHWEVLEFDPSGTFWGLAEFHGAIYLCSSAGLFRYVDGGVTPISIVGARGAPYRLAADDSFLWVLGFNDLMRYDGEEWLRLDC